MKQRFIFKKLKTYLKKYHYQFVVLALFSVSVSLINVLPYNIFARVSYLGKLVIIFMLAVILFKIKNSAIFFASLFSFILIFIFLASGNQKASEIWAMAVYSFLFLAILRSLFTEKKETNQNP